MTLQDIQHQVLQYNGEDTRLSAFSILAIADSAIFKYQFNPTHFIPSDISLALAWKHPHADRVADIEVLHDGNTSVCLASPSHDLDVSWDVVDTRLPGTFMTIGVPAKTLNESLEVIKNFLITGVFDGVE